MKTNLYKALNNNMALTIRLYARWLFRLGVLFFSVSLLAACDPKTEEDQIAAINKQIAPDGHLTKTHLYIHWPTVYTEATRNDPVEKEIVPVITIKIPVEYLAQGLFSYKNMLKQRIPALRNEDESKIDYASRINVALSIHKHQITMVSLGMQPGAKPYTPMVPYDSDPPNVAQRKLENFFGFYAVHVRRNDYYAVPIRERKRNSSPYNRPPSISCIGTTCYANFGVKGRLAKISGEGEGLENYYKTKAARSSQITTEASAHSSSDKGRTSLPTWHEKVDPTQALLNSFILPEDSPEIKGMFTGE